MSVSFRQLSLLFWIAVCGVIPGFTNLANADENAIKLLQQLGKPIKPLRWVNPSGQVWEFPKGNDEESTVVAFLSFSCPISNRTVVSLNELYKSYKDRKVEFIGVVCQDLSDEQLEEKQKAFRIEFQLITDPNLTIANHLNASGTPQVFLFDQNHRLQYFGAVNDQYIDRTTRALKVDQEYLKDAIDSSLQGSPVFVQHTDVIGCLFSAKSAPVMAGGKITFHEHIEPIIQEKCQKCHHPDDVAPFSLLTYTDALSWADDIKSFVVDKKMPPWSLTGGVAMKNDISLTDIEINLISEWVDSGAPKGDETKAPPPKQFLSRSVWENNETPDGVFQIPSTFHLGPDGIDHYRTIAFPIGNTEPIYINKIEFIPGNRRIVHHALMFFDGTGQVLDAQDRLGKRNYESSEDEDFGPGYESGMGLGFVPSPNITQNKDNPCGNLGGWAPGIAAITDPPNSAHLVPPGSSIVLQIHYHRTGKREIDDSTKVGIWYSKSPSKLYANGLMVNSSMRMIPKGNGHYKSTGKRILEEDMTLWLINPHMHNLGKEFRAWTIAPGSKEKKLIAELTNWDFNWQTKYLLKDPIPLAKGTTVMIECIWDNSDRNPCNPNSPPKNVFLGEGTNDEMGFAIIGVLQQEPQRSSDYLGYMEKLFEANALKKLYGEK